MYPSVFSFLLYFAKWIWLVIFHSILHIFSFSQVQDVQKLSYSTQQSSYATNFLLRKLSFAFQYLDVTYSSSLIIDCFDQLLGRLPKLNQHGLVLEAAIEAAAHAVINIRDSLNEWDAKAGDGDCGSTVSLLLYHSLGWMKGKISAVLSLIPIKHSTVVKYMMFVFVLGGSADV